MRMFVVETDFSLSLTTVSCGPSALQSCTSPEALCAGVHELDSNKPREPNTP